jgi:multiple sugar transport system permease protein
VNEAPKWNYLMAMSTLVALPIIALFFAAQRYFIEGITFTGMKE